MQENLQHTSLKPRWNQTARWLALIGGVINPIAFVLAYTVADLLRPGYSPIHQAISDLGVGPNGSLLDAIAVLHGLLLTAFAVGFALLMRQVLTVGWRWVVARMGHLLARRCARDAGAGRRRVLGVQAGYPAGPGAGGRAAGTGVVCGDAGLVCRLRVATVCPGRLAPARPGASSTVKTREHKAMGKGKRLCQR